MQYINHVTHNTIVTQLQSVGIQILRMPWTENITSCVAYSYSMIQWIIKSFSLVFPRLLDTSLSASG